MLVNPTIQGAGANAADAPAITFNGRWLPWHIEFYGGKAYWEAWFFSSGTLTAAEPYVADAWGIGGGSGSGMAGSTSTLTGHAGIPNEADGITLSGSIAITIGAGAGSSSSTSHVAGGATRLGSVLTCDGGSKSQYAGYYNDAYKRYRFSDDSKASESHGGCNVSRDGSYYAQNGWLATLHPLPGGGYGDCVMGEGYGAGGGYGGYASSGALVIRVPM